MLSAALRSSLWCKLHAGALSPCNEEEAWWGYKQKGPVWLWPENGFSILQNCLSLVKETSSSSCSLAAIPSNTLWRIQVSKRFEKRWGLGGFVVAFSKSLRLLGIKRIWKSYLKLVISMWSGSNWFFSFWTLIQLLQQWIGLTAVTLGPDRSALRHPFKDTHPFVLLDLLSSLEAHKG